MQGNVGTVRSGLVLCLKRSGILFQWTLISATVCLLIRALERIHSAIASLIGIIFGFSWALTTYFVLPIIISENIGPIHAFRQSIQLIGRGWRKLLFLNVILIAILFGLLGVGNIIYYLSPEFFSNHPINPFVVVFLFIILLVFNKIINCIFNSALYLNINGQELHGFNIESVSVLIERK